MSTSPRFVGGWAQSTISTMGVLPPLWMQPRDFSSRVVMPPSRLPGEGWVLRTSSPAAICSSSRKRTRSRMRWATSGVAARRASRCSAPIISTVSENIEVPPAAIILSLIMPMTGFETSPLVASEPPHSMPSMSSEISHSSRRHMEASMTMRRAIFFALAAVSMVPPSSWMSRPSMGLSVRARSSFIKPSMRFISQPRPMATTP